MEAEYIINACSGICIEALPGQEIAVIDLEGGQVVDFFAENAENREEFLSTGVTIDCNESLLLSGNVRLLLPKWEGPSQLS